jgi:hypothetical protein
MVPITQVHSKLDSKPSTINSLSPSVNGNMDCRVTDEGTENHIFPHYDFHSQNSHTAAFAKHSKSKYQPQLYINQKRVLHNLKIQ